jgi:hypothetical protein
METFILVAGDHGVPTLINVSHENPTIQRLDHLRFIKILSNIYLYI